MPATPVIISANVSRAEVNGVAILGFQGLEYTSKDTVAVEGIISVKNTDSTLDNILATPKKGPFKLMITIRSHIELVDETTFECYLKEKTLLMDANGVVTTKYLFTGKKQPEAPTPVGTNTSSGTSSGLGTSTVRPTINVIKRDGQTLPFSRQKLESSITNAGATPQQANLVSSRVISRVGNQQSITTRELSTMTARSLSRVNTTASRNYTIFRNQKYGR